MASSSSELDTDVERLRSASPPPPWLVSIERPIAPAYRCPQPVHDPAHAVPPVRNAGGKEERRIRATVRPHVDDESVVAVPPVRVELDVVDSGAYPRESEMPRMWVRSVLSGFEDDDGRVPDSFFRSVPRGGGERAGPESDGGSSCNLVENMLRHFATHCMKRGEDSDLRFEVGTEVLANVGSWRVGTITKLWDGAFPYRIRLHGDDGHEVFAPHDSDDVVRSLDRGDQEQEQAISGYGEQGPPILMPRDAWAANVGRWQKANRFSKDACDGELFQETMDAFPAKWLSPEVAHWLHGGGGGAGTGPADFCVRLADGIFTFPLFSAEFCGKVIAEYERCMALADSAGVAISRPNSMNKSGAIMSELGLEPLVDCLQDGVLAPLAKALFPVVGEELTNHHSFLIKYTPSEDKSLDMHTDDSDITFNVCLGKRFTGSGLQFCGQMGAAGHRHRTLRYRHRIGWCVAHLGSRRHGADDIATGERISLIVWNRNKVWRRSSEYLHRVYQINYERESGPPDPVCVSWTHDVDWEEYRGPRPGQGMRPWCPPPFAQHDSNSD